MTSSISPKHSSELTLPDQVHIDQLREALWSSDIHGRAAVMIGSGFSRNAKPVGPKTPTFPLWAELMKKIIRELMPLGDAAQEHYQYLKELSQSTSGALRLAQEYEALHGRSKLERLLKKAIPDNHYSPDKIHHMLLQLPWADVFTTNWDTLLDRAADSLYERRYDRVLRKEDIPFTMRPRLVKLHGSFPSITPFILTEDDFRTYPLKFSPFVNLVQQSMMENLFCLIGFSGDDPNFLAWSGWIRDNLGNNRPNIYLCGLLNLREGERRLLEERKIIPIDLSPLFFSQADKNLANRHNLSIEWFLKNLMKGEPPKAINWPTTQQSDVNDIDDLLKIPGFSGPVPIEEKILPPQRGAEKR